MYSFRNRPEKLAFLLVSKARTTSLNLPTMFTPGIRAHGTVAGTKNAGADKKSRNRVGISEAFFRIYFLFRNEYMYKSVAYLLTMHVYCVYQKVQATFYFWKIAETSGLLIIF
jgi:hypothetical protein